MQSVKNRYLWGRWVTILLPIVFSVAFAVNTMLGYYGIEAVWVDDDIIIKEEKVDGEMVITKKKKWQKMTSHVARHTFISINLAEGKPITEVQHAVGHASTDMTCSYAVHVEN